MARPSVLFLVHRVPYPPDRGDRIRSYHLLEFLAKRADVSLGFLHEGPLSEQTLPSLQPFCQRIAAVPLGRMGRWISGCASLATGGTATEGLFSSGQLRQTIDRWRSQCPFDVVVAFCSSMGPYAQSKGLSDVPLILDLVDVDSQKFLDYAGGASWPKSWLYRLEGLRLRRLEVSLGQHAEAVTLVSEAEAELYRSFAGDARVVAAGNGVDLDYFSPQGSLSGSKEDADEEIEGRCAFVGAMDYRANIDGVSWFCESVWPRVRREQPQATFVIVGRDPAPAVVKLGELPGVEVTGSVPDVRPHVRRASVVVAPLRVARGIQNKVLEALALGKAVLASPQALEGIALTPGEHALQVDSADDWAESLVGLFADPGRRRQLGLAGRQFVEAEHTWEARLKPFGELLEEVTSGMPASTS